MPPWLTVPQVAAALGTHPEVVRRWLRLGRLPGTKFGHTWRVPADAVAPKPAASTPVNVLHGRVRHVDLQRGIACVATDGAALVVQGLGLRHGMRLCVHLRATDILVSRRRLHGISARNQWPGVVESLLHHEGGVEVRVRSRPTLVAWMTPGAVQELALRPGVAVMLVFKAGACQVRVEVAASGPAAAGAGPRARRRGTCAA